MCVCVCVYLLTPLQVQNVTLRHFSEVKILKVLNPEFYFSQPNQDQNQSLHDSLFIARVRIVGYLHLPSILALCEMQTA